MSSLGIGVDPRANEERISAEIADCIFPRSTTTIKIGNDVCRSAVWADNRSNPL